MPKSKGGGAPRGNKNASGTHMGTGRNFKPTIGSTLRAGAIHGAMFGALGGAIGGPVGAAAGALGGALSGGAYHRTGDAGRKYAHKKAK